LAISPVLALLLRLVRVANVAPQAKGAVNSESLLP
jgi:hypothetical protein